MTIKTTAPLESGEPRRSTENRPTFTVTLRSKFGTDGHAALRAVLKRALRDHGLVALAIREESGR